MGAEGWPRPLEEEGGVRVWGLVKRDPPHPQETDWDPKGEVGAQPMLRTPQECTEREDLRHKLVSPPYPHAQAKPSPRAWAQDGSLSSTTGAVGSGFWASKALAQSSKATDR